MASGDGVSQEESLAVSGRPVAAGHELAPVTRDPPGTANVARLIRRNRRVRQCKNWNNGCRLGFNTKMSNSNTLPAEYAVAYPNLIHLIQQGEVDRLFELMISEVLQRRDNCEREAKEAVEYYTRRRNEGIALRERISELDAKQTGGDLTDSAVDGEQYRTVRVEIEEENKKSAFNPKDAMRALAHPECAVKDLYILKSLMDELRILGIYKAIETERSVLLRTVFATLDPNRLHGVAYIEKQVPWLRLLFGYPAINELRLMANCIKHSGRPHRRGGGTVMRES
jgi:BMFP domain-containing protein YqiC